eukprot:Skav236284  [mRNA]  locus=scaffold2529:19957:21147:+ [translate_table: standard]
MAVDHSEATPVESRWWLLGSEAAVGCRVVPFAAAFGLSCHAALRCDRPTSDVGVGADGSCQRIRPGKAMGCGLFPSSCGRNPDSAAMTPDCKHERTYTREISYWSRMLSSRTVHKVYICKVLEMLIAMPQSVDFNAVPLHKAELEILWRRSPKPRHTQVARIVDRLEHRSGLYDEEAFKRAIAETWCHRCAATAMGFCTGSDGHRREPHP